jgi:hypothetical protein
MSAFNELAVPDLVLTSSPVLSHMCMAKMELFDLPPHMVVFSPSQTASHCVLSLSIGVKYGVQ